MSPLQQAILLFILAFLAGFFILYLWRRNAQAQKYQAAIEEHATRQQENLHLLEQTEEKMQHARSDFDQIHTQLQEQSETLRQLHDEEATLLQNIEALEAEQKRLLETKAHEEAQTATLQNRIETLSSDLEALQSERKIIAANEREIAKLEDRLQEQKQLHESYLSDIEKLKSERKAFREKSQELDSRIFDAKAKLHALQTQIAKIESKYAKALRKAEENLEDLKIRAINYEYALKEYLHTKGDAATKIEDKLVQKLFKVPDTKSREIDAFVHKNDASRWIDRIRQTLLKKASSGKEA